MKTQVQKPINDKLHKQAGTERCWNNGNRWAHAERSKQTRPLQICQRSGKFPANHD